MYFGYTIPNVSDLAQCETAPQNLLIPTGTNPFHTRLRHARIGCQCQFVFFNGLPLHWPFFFSPALVTKGSADWAREAKRQKLSRNRFMIVFSWYLKVTRLY